MDNAEEQNMSLDEYHRALIEEGIRAADARDLIPHSEVVQMVAEWPRKRHEQDALRTAANCSD